MQVERINNEIVIRIPSDMDTNRLQEILNLVRDGELTSKSTATQDEVDELASEINKNWWAKNRSKFLK